MNMRRLLKQMKSVAPHMIYCAEVEARMLFLGFSQEILVYRKLAKSASQEEDILPILSASLWPLYGKSQWLNSFRNMYINCFEKFKT